MFRIQSSRLACLLIGCFLWGAMSQTPAIASDIVETEELTSVETTHNLAKNVLAAMGMPERYDLYLRNGTDAVIGSPVSQNTEFMTWLHNIFVQEAGWQYVEEFYISQLEQDFSEAELNELLVLAEQPLIQRLFQTEMAAYLASMEQRQQLLDQLWQDYNNGVYIPPAITW